MFTVFYSHAKPFNQDYLYLSLELASLEGNHDQALKFLEQIDLDKKNPDIQLRKAQEFKNKGLSLKSQRICEFLIQKFPQHQSVVIESHLLLGEINRSLKLFKKALFQYEKVLEINPSHQKALFEHSLLLVQMEQALPLNRKQLFEENFSFYRALGDIYLEKGFKSQALASFKKSLSLNPSDRYVAWRLFQLEKPLSYIKFLEHLKPSDSFVISLLGRSYLKTKQKEKVQGYLEDLLWSDHSVLALKAEWIMGRL